MIASSPIATAQGTGSARAEHRFSYPTVRPIRRPGGGPLVDPRTW